VACSRLKLSMKNKNLWNKFTKGWLTKGQVFTPILWTFC